MNTFKIYQSSYIYNEKISSNNFSTLLRVIVKNKQMTIDLLKDLTKLNIKEIEFEDLKNIEL